MSPPVKKAHTFGAVMHRDPETNELILIPTPSVDPNDPLNWSQPFKFYIAGIICLAMFMCNLVSAGPSVALVEISKSFFPDWQENKLAAAISKTSYCFTSASLLQGTSNLVWVPLVNKYGRRPVYLISFLVYFVSIVWSSFTSSYSSFLAARIFTGFGSGAAETIAPLTIADVFFLHERGAIMGWYTAALSCGVSGGMIIDGLITIDNSWRYIFYVAIALVGATLLLALATFPETMYVRQPVNNSQISDPNAEEDKAYSTTEERLPPMTIVPKKKTYFQMLRIFSGTYTKESFFTLSIRPLVLIILPPVLWGALVMSVTIGFLVAITSNVASAFTSTYGFQTYQVGLCFIGALIGSLIGIPTGGHLGDWVSDYLAKRNGGIRQPEMRLPAISISVITAPASLILYGAGIQYKLHWMVPTIGLSLLNFSIAQATNISLTYTIDAYRPITGEITMATMGFKSLIGFLLSFYTNPWIGEVGYLPAYGTMAAIAGFFLVLWVPFYIWGEQIRRITWDWKVSKYAHWSEDREVGE